MNLLVKKVSDNEVFSLIEYEYTYILGPQIGIWYQEERTRLHNLLSAKGQLSCGSRVFGENKIYEEMLERILEGRYCLIRKYCLRFDNEITEETKEKYQKFIIESADCPAQLEVIKVDEIKSRVRRNAQCRFNVLIKDVNYCVRTSKKRNWENVRNSMVSGVLGAIIGALLIIITG